MNQEIPVETLITKALEMLHYAYVPYSRYTVGAALLTAEGDIYTGCNIENAAYGPSNCAERTAFFKAVSEGKKHFTAIAVVGGPNGTTNEYCTPCGVCRQVMVEFCKKDFAVIIAKSPSDYKIKTLEELLPDSFNPQDEIGANAVAQQ